METLHAQPGEHSTAFCVRALRIARSTGLTIRCEFNGAPLIANCSSTVDGLYEQFDLPHRREYFGQSAKFKTLNN